MIRTESEYRAAVSRWKENGDMLDQQRRQLEEAGLTDDEVERAMQPVTSFHLQLGEDIAWYENACRGSVTPVHNLNEIGRVLIALRISQGLTQKQLAGTLDVSEAAVSRDERNEYHGITVERAQRVLDALGAEIVITLTGMEHEHESPEGKRRRKRELSIA